MVGKTGVGAKGGKSGKSIKPNPSGTGRKSLGGNTAKGTQGPLTKTKKYVEFNVDKRKDFLTGFSKRKKERRVYGLAMGELKKRNDYLVNRKERTDDKKEQNEKLLERVKLNRKGDINGDFDFGADEDVVGSGLENVNVVDIVGGEAVYVDEDGDAVNDNEENDGNESDASVDADGNAKPKKKTWKKEPVFDRTKEDALAKKHRSYLNPSGSVLKFETPETNDMFGGNVTVSVTYGLDSFKLSDRIKSAYSTQSASDGNDGCYDGMTMSYDDDDDLLESRQKGLKQKDMEQHQAHNVTSYMSLVKKTIGNKKREKLLGKSKKGWSGKGTHGASGMKGVKDVKTVKKLLMVSEKKKGGTVVKEGAGGNVGKKKQKQGFGKNVKGARRK